jgi:hypothetical protein
VGQARYFQIRIGCIRVFIRYRTAGFSAEEKNRLGGGGMYQKKHTAMPLPVNLSHSFSNSVIAVLLYNLSDPPRCDHVTWKRVATWMEFLIILLPAILPILPPTLVINLVITQRVVSLSRDACEAFSIYSISLIGDKTRNQCQTTKGFVSKKEKCCVRHETFPTVWCGVSGCSLVR